MHQRVLDLACGSGAFIAAAVNHFVEATEAEQDGTTNPRDTLDQLRDAVISIDIHPVAVYLARTAWILAARPVIEAVVNANLKSDVSVPVYLGDSLQLRFRTGDMFAEHEVLIQVYDPSNTELVFPVNLINRPDTFDAFMTDIATNIEQGQPVYLHDNDIEEEREIRTMETTIEAMSQLHAQGRNHIWAYYTRNLVRPVVLAQHKVNVIVGNPPWINYNKTFDILRTELALQRRFAGRELWAPRHGDLPACLTAWQPSLRRSDIWTKTEKTEKTSLQYRYAWQTFIEDKYARPS